MDRLQVRYFVDWLRYGQGLIDRPRLPHQLSEGLVAYLATQLFGSMVVCRGKTNDGDSDLLLHLLDGCLSVEVKGSGFRGWVQVTKKDLRAAYLVWVHFGERYENGGVGPIEIYVLAEPGKVLKRGKPRIKKFTALPGVRSFRFDFDSKALVETTL